MLKQEGRESSANVFLEFFDKLLINAQISEKKNSLTVEDFGALLSFSLSVILCLSSLFWINMNK